MKRFFKLLPILILLLALVGGVILVKKTQELRRGAAGDQLNLSIQPETFQIDVGQEKTLAVFANIGDLKTVYASVKLNSASQFLEIVEVIPNIGGEDNQFETKVPTFGVDESTGEITLALKSSTKTVTGAVKLATIKVRGLANGSGNLSFAPADQQRVTDFDAENYIAVDQMSGSSFTVGGESTIGTVSLEIKPDGQSYEIGQEIPVKVTFLAGENRLTLVNVLVSFDNQLLELIPAKSQINSQGPLNQAIENTLKGSNRYSMVAVATNIENPATGEFVLGTITFKAKQAGSTGIDLVSQEVVGLDSGGADGIYSVNFQKENFTIGSVEPTITQVPTPTDVPVCIAGDKDCGGANGRPRICQAGQWTNLAPCSAGQSCSDGNCIVVTTGVPTKVPTPTAIPDSGTPILNFKVSFVGILNKDKVKEIPKVAIKVKKGFETVAEFDGVEVVPTDVGDKTVFTGAVALTGVVPGGNYSVLIKGPKHLARKFCQNNQVDRCYGQGEIILVEGENSFDFSGLSLEPGDLPNPSYNMAQDGVVNGVDLALIKARFFVDQHEEEKLVADLDFNGDIGGRDIVLFLQTLSAKFDEEE
ncbi:MAG: hypothetical protein ABID04_00275 [Patescibacteria group bacterium]